MDFLRNVRVASLIEQFRYWSNQANMDNFYNNLPHSKNSELGISKYQDGYIWFKDGTLTYNNLLNGATIKLRKHWAPADYQAYSELQKTGSEQGLFKFDIPVYRDVVEVDGNSVEYIEFESPTNRHGSSYFNFYIDKNKPSKEETEKILTDYVVAAEKILRVAKEVSSKFKCGVPLDLCRPTNLFDFTEEQIWTEAMDWGYSFEIAVDKHIEFLKLFCDKIKEYYPAIDTNPVISQAEELWKAI